VACLCAALRPRVYGRALGLDRQLLRPGAEGMRRALAIATLLALSIPAPAFARGTFDPTTEFEQHEWIPIHLGPLNLSITKAVAYLLLGTALTILLGLFLMRARLALLPLVFTQIEGIRWNGPVRYFKSWIPEAPKPLLALIVPLEVLGQFMRLISLSVRLFANMLAGHILILTFIGLLFILQSVYLALVTVPVATAFYLFEVVIVVSIQAFIFAALSAIYIGSAIEPEHEEEKCPRFSVPVPAM